MGLIYFPFALQALAMLFDEFYFHYRRELKLWERLGHPLDTLTVLVCYGFLLTNDYNQTNLNIFIALSAFSSIFITKDEWVHKEAASAEENWLHAILFVLHPLSFLSAAMIWKDQSNPVFLQIQTAITFLFMLYQILYWSIPWKKIRTQKIS